MIVNVFLFLPVSTIFFIVTAVELYFFVGFYFFPQAQNIVTQ